jgi:hypothetical protein
VTSETFPRDERGRGAVSGGGWEGGIMAVADGGAKLGVWAVRGGGGGWRATVGRGELLKGEAVGNGETVGRAVGACDRS